MRLFSGTQKRLGRQWETLDVCVWSTTTGAYIDEDDADNTGDYETYVGTGKGGHDDVIKVRLDEGNEGTENSKGIIRDVTKDDLQDGRVSKGGAIPI